MQFENNAQDYEGRWAITQGRMRNLVRSAIEKEEAFRHSLGGIKRGVEGRFAFGELKKHRRIHRLVLSGYTGSFSLSLIKPTVNTMLNTPFLGPLNNQQTASTLNAFFSHPLLAVGVIYAGSVACEFKMWGLAMKAVEKTYNVAKNTYPCVRDAFERDTKIYPRLMNAYQAALVVAKRDSALYPRIRDAIGRLERPASQIADRLV